MIYYRLKDQFKSTKCRLFNRKRLIYIENDDLYQKLQPKLTNFQYILNLESKSECENESQLSKTIDRTAQFGFEKVD